MLPANLQLPRFGWFRGGYFIVRRRDVRAYFLSQVRLRLRGKRRRVSA